MALINCPHCGKQVSDTVEVCIHCGKRIDGTAPEKTEPPQSVRKGYENLTDYERRELEKEFTKGKPKYDKYFGKPPYYQYALKISTGVDLFGCLILCCGIIFKTNSSSLSLLLIILGSVLTGIGVICEFSFYFAMYKYRKNLLIVLKKYQKWLQSVKGINYVLNFKWMSGRWQRYFDGINADVEDI